jgi:hypothetical protein
MSKVTYNNLSERLKKEIGWGKPLGRDEVVEFQLVHIPLLKQNGELLPYYSNTRLPNVDAIYDPYAEGGPQMVQIAYVVNETANTEKEPTKGLGEIVFDKVNKCVITISGREPNKIGLLNFLRASNYNQTNAQATPSSYGFIFRELEPVKNAKQKLKERLERNQCESYIDGMKEAELVSMLKALKQRTYSSLDENKLALVDFVQTKANRDKFNSLSKDARMPVAALITKAVELELIKYNEEPMTWNYTSSGNMITQVPPQTDYNEHLIEYFHNNTTGKSVAAFLEKEIAVIYAAEDKKEAEKDLAKAEKKK